MCILPDGEPFQHEAERKVVGEEGLETDSAKVGNRGKDHESG